jgi:hypothetical protein
MAPEIYDYVYGYFVFSGIGHSLTVNMTEDFDKAANVAFWVFDNIKGFSRWQRHRFMPVIDDSALCIYRRGFGYCDQGAHVYATIMHYLGFKVKLLMLKNDEGVSNHTVAIVYVGGKPMIVDTAYKFIFADNNKNPIAIDELGNSEIFDEYLNIVKSTDELLKIEYSEFKPSWFKNGTSYETFPYCKRQDMIGKIADRMKKRFIRPFERH